VWAVISSGSRGRMAAVEGSRTRILKFNGSYGFR
jgi:hypothetical protein